MSWAAMIETTEIFNPSSNVYEGKEFTFFPSNPRTHRNRCKNNYIKK
jgi:hypothetical protein